MPKYKFKAMDINNKKIKGIFIAQDDDDLKTILTNQNYYLISYKKIAESSQLFAFLEKIKTRDFTLFCRQFAIMLKAGLNIDKSVFILKNSCKNQKLKSILEVVYNDLMKGKMLSESFAKYPKTFPVFFRNMVEIGETSGKLDLIFERLADYYEKEAKTKRKIKSALSYPIFLLIIAFAALAVIAVFVMPNFSSMFDQFGADLPGISKAVINVSTFIQDNILNIILYVFLIIVIFILLGKLKSVRRLYDKIKLNMPFFKNLTIASITSRFANGFSVLLNSGIPLLSCVNTISKLLGNKIVEEKLQVVKNEISSGRTVAKSLETINLFPDMLIEMISVGESTGNLEEVLNKITDYFEEQLDIEIKSMTAAIEPVMIIFIGLIVVVVLLAIFLPMLELMSAIEGAE
ncbi:MAG: type II secretion system F family protein [Bacilli bacterium]|nr:type II secretion system F family protein [Mollicutes bacterium]MDY3899962.1 type II secretion system F family protein [Bacilli bacterium]